MEQVTLSLVVNVEYLLNTTTEEQLRFALLSIVNRAVEEGSLTNDTDAEVEDWTARTFVLD